MNGIYNFFLDVADTIQDGADFVFRTATLHLKRFREKNELSYLSSNPIADDQPPLLPQYPPAPSPTTKEERPFKRPRLAFVTTTPTSTAAPSPSTSLPPLSSSMVTAPPIPAVPVPSVAPSTQPNFRYPSSGLSKVLQAAIPSKPAFAARRHPKVVIKEPPMPFPRAEKHYYSRITGKPVYPRRSNFPARISFRSSKTSGTLPSKTLYTFPTVLPVSPYSYPLIENSAAGTNINSSECSSRLILTGKRQLHSISKSQQQKRFQSTDLRPKIAQISNIHRSNVLSVQIQPFVHSISFRQMQVKSSESSNSE